MDALTLPAPLRAFFNYFPVHSYPAIPVPPKYRLSNPTIWVAPPRNTEVDFLSSDVECLKWQAYLALRGLSNVAVRWDVAPEGALGGILPNVQIPISREEESPQLLAAHMIPGWVDGKLASNIDPLEGYRDAALRDESHAWVTLLEGPVHVSLMLSQPQSSLFTRLVNFESKTGRPIESLTNPPPAFFSGLSSLVPPFGTHIQSSSVQARYTEAIGALSERLGKDKWFLGSENPTALDALAFAYLHTILQSKDALRIEVSRRVNLVTWERKVRTQVQAAFHAAS